MRTLTFDPYEFDNSATEEYLELWIASKSTSPFTDVRMFVAASANIKTAETLGAPQAFEKWFGYGFIGKYLLRFAGVELPQSCDWLTFVLNHDDTDWDLVFETPSLFIRYHWYTTA